MTLWDLVSNQKDKEFFIRTVTQLQEKFDLVGRVQPIQEEEKKDGGGFGQPYQPYKPVNRPPAVFEHELSEEEKELIEIYGESIRMIKWYFENDASV